MSCLMLNKIIGNKIRNVFTFIILLFVMGHFASAEDNVNTNDWQFSGNVYLWGAEIKADAASGSKIDIPFHTIIDNLDMAMMGSIGARKDKLKFFADIIYLDLEDSEKGSTSISIGPRVRRQIIIGDKLEIALKAWVVQPMAGYTIYETTESSIELAVGARYLWIEVDSELRTTGPFANRKVKTSDSGHNWDGIVAIKGKMKLSNKWDAAVYIDGGSGDSDYTWQGLAGLSYQFDNFKGAFGYRHLKWEFDGRSALEDLKISGPYVGARFNF